MKRDISIKAAHKPKKALTSPTVTVERPVRHITKNLSFYRVRFEDLDGRTCWIDIPRKDFVKPADAVGKLLEAHARIPRDPKEASELVLRALEAMGEKPTLEITDKVGWDTSSKNAPSFVYFGKTFGPKSDDLLFDDDGVCNGALGKRKGTRKDWRSGLEPACAVSDELVVAISIASSGPLYEMIGATEACIYHFEGARKPAGDKRQYKSSSGKTLCARVAQSMFGKCSSGDLFSSNMTPLAVEETCFSCNQLAVIIDEEGAAAGAEGKTVPRVTLPYRIVGGQGKRRSKYYGNGGGASAQSWLVPVISTSEEELDKGVSKRKEGEQVRMVAIPFPPTWKGGTFRAAKSKKRRNKLAQQVEATIAANYGVAMPKYLAYLVKNYDRVAKAALETRDTFVRQVGADNNSWERRYAQKFGILLAAAKTLVECGVAPWTAERAEVAITNVYRASRGLTVSIPEATDKLLDRLRTEVTAGRHFPRIGKGGLLKPGVRGLAWGVVRPVGGQINVTVIKADCFEKLVRPAAAHAVLKELDRRGLLLKDPHGNRKQQVLIPALTDKRARYVCIKGLAGKSTSKA